MSGAIGLRLPSLYFFLAWTGKIYVFVFDSNRRQTAFTLCSVYLYGFLFTKWIGQGVVAVVGLGTVTNTKIRISAGH
jgi:hypothetical protein